MSEKKSNSKRILSNISHEKDKEASHHELMPPAKKIKTNPKEKKQQSLASLNASTKAKRTRERGREERRTTKRGILMRFCAHLSEILLQEKKEKDIFLKKSRVIFGDFKVYKVAFEKGTPGKWAYYKQKEKYIKVSHNSSFLYSKGQFDKGSSMGACIEGTRASVS